MKGSAQLSTVAARLPGREAADPERGGAFAELPSHEGQPGAAKPSALMVGAAPPPYNGSIMMFWTLMTSPLRERFRLVHLDISDHRGLENIARLDFENVRLGIRHALDCVRALKRARPEVVYVPVAWNPLAFFRDS